MHTAFNPMGVGDMAKDYIIDYGGNNNKWYRLWKSGWIEQGGVFSNEDIGAPNLNYSMLKSFSNNNYTLILTGSHTDNSSSVLTVQYGNKYYGCILSGSKTVNSFKYRSGPGAGWYACGF